MCVIIHTARKDLLKETELKTAMRKNSSGFFIAELLANGKRNSIRTLSSAEAEEFWDGIPSSSEVVMHFRIPSKGGTTIANVHGWDESGILFSHNRTLYNLFPLMAEDKWEGTDSEYFFRKIFMPLYKKMGGRGGAYRDGKLCPSLDHIVRAICGDFNKFMFVMPDNHVLRYGDWEGDDSERPGFHASNKSYLEDRKPTIVELVKKFFSRK